MARRRWRLPPKGMGAFLSAMRAGAGGAWPAVAGETEIPSKAPECAPMDEDSKSAGSGLSAQGCTRRHGISCFRSVGFKSISSPGVRAREAGQETSGQVVHKLSGRGILRTGQGAPLASLFVDQEAAALRHDGLLRHDGPRAASRELSSPLMGETGGRFVLAVSEGPRFRFRIVTGPQSRWSRCRCGAASDGMGVAPGRRCLACCSA